LTLPLVTGPSSQGGVAELLPDLLGLGGLVDHGECLHALRGDNVGQPPPPQFCAQLLRAHPPRMMPRGPHRVLLDRVRGLPVEAERKAAEGGDLPP